MVMNHEMTEHRRLYRRGSAAARLPEPRRTKAFEELDVELARSWSPTARLLAPNIRAIARAYDQYHAERDQVLVGAAVRLFEAEHGRAPQKLSELPVELPLSLRDGRIELEADGAGVCLRHRNAALAELRLTRRNATTVGALKAPSVTRPR
jgi:hypothetical protein